jgi:hypothetical protein
MRSVPWRCAVSVGYANHGASVVPRSHPTVSSTSSTPAVRVLDALSWFLFLGWSPGLVFERWITTITLLVAIVRCG